MGQERWLLYDIDPMRLDHHDAIHIIEIRQKTRRHVLLATNIVDKHTTKDVPV